ncbi:MAG: T9SS type A sorting domain-containing protein, partial [Candidatus Omnitrophica bacterium]|nr:T9SS type A sorting domain-containing protein [Candidatus Omnitrophota bacterium]
DIGVASVWLYYREAGKIEYEVTSMLCIAEDIYQGCIPQSFVLNLRTKRVEYYIDAIGNSIGYISIGQPGTKDNPNIFPVSDVTLPQPPCYAESGGTFDGKVQLKWYHSTSADVAKYNIYGDNGSGIIDYSRCIATIFYPDKTWICNINTQNDMTYKFVVRAVDSAGNEESNNKILNTNLIMEPWEDSTSLPFSRHGYLSVIKKNRIFIIGGGHTENENLRPCEPISPTVTVYSAQVNNSGTVGEWREEINSLPEKRCYYAGVSYKDYVYVIGGLSYGYTNYAQRTVFFARINDDGTMGNWETTTPLPLELGSNSAAIVGDHIYVVGGYSKYSKEKVVLYTKVNADGTLGNWKNTTQLPSCRFFHSTVSKDKKIYVLGGFDANNGVCDTVLMSTVNDDGTLNSWECTTPLPVPRASGSAAIVGNKIYWTGGLNPFISYSNYINSGETRDTVWYTSVNENGHLGSWNGTACMPSDRMSIQISNYNSNLYIVGGQKQHADLLETDPDILYISKHTNVWHADISRMFSPVLDQAPPTISISVTPKEVKEVGEITVTVTGMDDKDLSAIWWWGVNAGDTELDKAHWYNCSGTSATNMWTIDTSSLAPGTYKLGANARDKAYPVLGEPHQASEGDGIAYTTFEIKDTTPPQVSITSPENGAVLQDKVNIDSIATDNCGIEKVELYLDSSTSPVNISTTSSCEWEWDTKASENGEYTIKAVAYDKAGSSAVCFIKVTVENDVTCPVISEVASNDVTGTSSKIIWKTDEPATSEVEYGTSTLYGYTSTKSTFLVTGHEDGIDGLTPDTIYYFRVRSGDKYGNSTISDSYSFRTLDTIAPEAVTSLKVSATGTGDSILLLWTTLSSDDVVGYNVYRDEGLIDSTTALNYIDKKVKEGEKYTYSLSCNDEAGNESEKISVEITPNIAPEKVSGLKVEVFLEGSELNLSWTANTESDLAGYRIYRKTAGTAYGFINISSSTYFTDMGLVDGTTCYYHVSAIDKLSNEGKMSNIISGVPFDTIFPEPVSDFKATSIAEGKIKLSWKISPSKDIGKYLIFCDNATGAIDYDKPFATICHSENTWFSKCLTNNKTYKFALRAQDKSGNIEKNTHLIAEVLTDATPPISGLQIFIKDTGWSNYFGYGFESVLGTAKDSISSINKVEICIKDTTNNTYSLGWGGWSGSEFWLTVTGKEKWAYDAYGLNWKPGHTYMVQSRAIDNAGNIEKPTSLGSKLNWKVQASMPTYRWGFGIGVVDGKIYSIGGYGGWGGEALNVVEEYNIKTNTWVKKAPMPTKRGALTVSVVNGKIYAIGGKKDINYNVCNVVEEYDPIKNKWITKTPIPAMCESMTSAVVNGKIYVIGGSLIEGHYYNDQTGITMVEEYNPVTDRWLQKSPMPSGREWAGSAVVNGKIYIIGGYDRGKIPPELNIYDPVSDAWSIGSDMPNPRWALACVSVNGKIYAIGGRGHKSHAHSTVDEYDPIKDIWISKSTLSKRRSYLCAAVVNDKIYAIGGMLANITEVADIELAQLAHEDEVDVSEQLDRAGAWIKVPKNKKRIRGNAVTVMAEATENTKGVLFQYKAPDSDEWINITGIDEKFPYAVYWNVSAIENGEYFLRAVAYNSDGLADISAEAITVFIDDGNSDIVEDGNPDVDPNNEHRKREKIETTQDNNAVIREVMVADGTSAAIASNLLEETTILEITLLKQETIASILPPPNSNLKATGVFREYKLENGQRHFSEEINLNLPYSDENEDGIVDGTDIRAEELKVFYFNETIRKWEEVRETEVISQRTRLRAISQNGYLYTGNSVSAQVNHFSIFALMAYRPATTLSNVDIYPNPLKPDRGNDITFDNLPDHSTIRIYAISGRLIKELKVTAADGGQKVWDTKNNSGDKVSSGVYIYLITNDVAGKTSGKLAIIR